ncbi:MAG: deoxyhypusine synthase family protein [archaeon]|nr:deoxyhypusine synthase family protein [archaeon]
MQKNIEEMQKELFGDVVKGKEITGKENLREIFEKGHPAFGGKLLRKSYQLIRKAIAENYTLFIALAGPVTASDYARTWIIPFIKSGYISAFTASDAITYHDAHDAVEGKRKIFDVELYGDDGAYKDAQIIRVTDIGFPEEVLFNTDKFFSHILLQEEFQKKMTTTEYRWLVGKYLFALEEKKNIPHGLLSTAFVYNVPGFCASPADGSTFLNATKLWAMKERINKLPKDFKFEIDLFKDVYEFCAYHYYCQHFEGNKELSYIVCGGGAAKNYLLQPEPALEQILFVPTKKYHIGVQFTTAPVTDGSLTSCWPSEAISWGKLQKDALTVSVPTDYTMQMSLIALAIMQERHELWHKLEEEFSGDMKGLIKKHPEAEGFLRKPLHLFKKREEAFSFLDKAFAEHLDELNDSLHFQL